MPGVLRILGLAVMLAALLAGCATKSQRTAKATGCSVARVDILSSEASRRGSTTDWCARCEGRIYRCISNADRDKIQCRPAQEEDRCG